MNILEEAIPEKDLNLLVAIVAGTTRPSVERVESTVNTVLDKDGKVKFTYITSKESANWFNRALKAFKKEGLIEGASEIPVFEQLLNLIVKFGHASNLTDKASKFREKKIEK